MRFINTKLLEKDMKLGKSLFDQKGRLLLPEGTCLKDNYIRKIQRLGYNGIYIDDVLSQGITVNDVVDVETRIEAVQVIKGTYSRLERGMYHHLQAAEAQLRTAVDNIVSEILMNNEIMINMVDLKMYDDYTFFHSTNVAVIAVVIGTALGFSRQDLYELCMAGMLHDLGKICISDAILNKPDRLTDDEMALIQTHPEQGYDVVKKKMNLPTRTYVAILQHHERIDGEGYPEGRTGERITLFARILSIADVYDALTSDRPYRRGWSPSEAVEYILGNCGSAFDRDLVEVFYRKISPYPAGTIVSLNDGRRGIVIRNHEGCGLRPTLKIISRDGKPVDAYLLDLRGDDTSTVVIAKEGVEPN